MIFYKKCVQSMIFDKISLANNKSLTPVFHTLTKKLHYINIIFDRKYWL